MRDYRYRKISQTAVMSAAARAAHLLVDSTSRAGASGRWTVFEVDDPATQAAKRRMLSVCGLGEPASVRYVPVTLGEHDLVPALCVAGFDPALPAFVSCLGLSMYLDVGTVDAVLAALGGFAPGSEAVIEYIVPAGLRDGRGAAYADAVSQAAGGHGEPWRTVLAPTEMDALLAANEPTPAEHLTQRDAVATACWDRADSLVPCELSMLVRAGRR